MKIRECFVSNSSSSSFILKNAIEIEKARKFNMQLFKVSDLIEKFKPLIDAKNLIETVTNYEDESIPFFIKDDLQGMFNVDLYFLNKLVEIQNEYPEAYITSEYDRDIASRNNINFEVFEGDL